MTPETAEMSRSIDSAELGRRIRNARIAAGLTQAQLAAGEVSAAYVSRIEDGQRRPGPELLGRMAERLGTTLDELLFGVSSVERRRLQVAVDHAELALAGGNAQEALDRATAVLTEVADTPLDDVRRGALEVRAFALEATGDLGTAIEALEELAARPTADRAWLKVLIALSRCYRDSGDLGRAIAIGERAEETIEELGIGGLTEAIQLSLTVAAAYTVRGDTAYAMVLCRRAIEAAEKYDSPVARASAYWNASLLESRRGNHDSALELARKALALFELGEDARNLSRLRVQMASLQLQLDPPDADGALETLTQAEREMLWSSASPIDVARQRLTRSRAHLVLGRLDDAAECLDRALEAVPDSASIVSASAYALRGELAAAQGRPDQARREYQHAVQVLTGIGADRDAAQLWFELGSLLSEAGDSQGALDAFKWAGASTGLLRVRPTARTASDAILR